MNQHNRTYDLLAVGNPCVDVAVAAERIPGWDDKALGQAVGLFAGGTEANVACAASRLGLRVAAFAEVGDDAHGSFLMDQFHAFGVSVALVSRRRHAASAMTVIFLSAAGERSIVYAPMAPPTVPRSGLADALASARIVYTMPYDVAQFAELSRAARQAGCEVAIDIEREVAHDPATFTRLLRSCDIAFMNASGFITGTEREPDVASLRALLQAGTAQTIVVSLGADGAIAVDRSGSAVQTAYPAKVVDTTGAGDTFNAAFLYARNRAQSLQQCLAFGCAAASFSVAHVGARSGLPTAAQVEAVTGAAT